VLSTVVYTREVPFRVMSLVFTVDLSFDFVPAERKIKTSYRLTASKILHSMFLHFSILELDFPTNE
jgi:hypothetical protein